MKDTQGNNLAANEVGKLNEMTTTTTETAAVSKEATVESVAAGKMTKEEILNKLRNMVEEPVSAVRDEIDSLKQAYYKIRKAEIEELKKTFVEQGGNVKDFNVPEDKYEALLKDLMNTFKEKRAAQIAEEEKLKAANYEVKLQLIEQLKNLCNSNEDFNKLYNEFKEIQQKWKDIKLVPEGKVNELWKEYQNYSEQFYDLIKINSQFRDYDFKKNLELKTALCESVEKLGTTKDTVSAFHQLQKLHQQWREIGPVAKELRESLWARFKAASTVINKRYVQFFEEQKEKELVNLQEKTALCEAVERIDCTLLKSAKDWEKKANEVFEIQKKWKTIGFTPKKHNTKIFERFRAACNVFFAKKSEFFKAMKSEMEEKSMSDNNSSAFNFRYISYSTKLSKHALGLAVDINTLYNPYVKNVDGRRNVEPANAEKYTDRSIEFPHKIDHDDLCYKVFMQHGFEWGGDWEHAKDYQHFKMPDE